MLVFLFLNKLLFCNEIVKTTRNFYEFHLFGCSGYDSKDSSSNEIDLNWTYSYQLFKGDFFNNIIKGKVFQISFDFDNVIKKKFKLSSFSFYITNTSDNDVFYNFYFCFLRKNIFFSNNRHILRFEFYKFSPLLFTTKKKSNKKEYEFYFLVLYYAKDKIKFNFDSYTISSTLLFIPIWLDINYSFQPMINRNVYINFNVACSLCFNMSINICRYSD